MKAIITCGPSYEPIDQARRLTNFSTGRLGIALSNLFVDHGWEVCCFKGEQATCADALRAQSQRSFTTNDDLASQLAALGRDQRFDLVLHAAALCDFRVERVVNEAGETVASPKFSTREGQLRLVLAPTVKVLPQLRGWFPGARIVGWKYELAGSREEAFARAEQQLREHGSHACVLNGAAHGPGFTACLKSGERVACADAGELGAWLVKWAGNGNAD